jgi:hypothetical protein
MAVGAALFGVMTLVRAPVNPETAAAPVTATAPAQVFPGQVPVLGTTATPTQQVASAVASLPEKKYTGMIASIDSKEHVLVIRKDIFSKKEFHLGENCQYTFLYTMLVNNDGATGNLRSGEKVTITYQDANGVLIADRIEQQPMQFAGIVKQIDPDKHTLTLRRHMFGKQLDIAADCVTVLRDEKACALADIHPGDRVVVMYETPGCRAIAREITKTDTPSPAR